MQQIELEQTPNQTFRITLNDYSWNLQFRTINDATYMTITRDDTELVSNVLCCAGVPVIQYSYLAKDGNFIFVTNDDTYPYYEDFGDTCKLYFYTEDDLA